MAIRVPPLSDGIPRAARLRIRPWSLYALVGVWFAWHAGHTVIAHFGLLAATSFLFMGGWSLWEQGQALLPTVHPITVERSESQMLAIKSSR